MKSHILTCILFFFLFCTGFLTGCGEDRSVSDRSSPPVFDTPTVLEPEAPGTEIIGYDPLIIDISHLNQGYCIASGDASCPGYNLQVTGPDEVTYSYFLGSGESGIIPFTCGNGDYSIAGYENISGTSYAALFLQTLSVELENEFLPFLYPNQYVDFNAESVCSQLGISLGKDFELDIEALDQIYNYVISNLSYDFEKAETVEPGYLPDVDEIISFGTGICFDYAAVLTCMLRSMDIPCKLQIGYSGVTKHAWVEVYIKNKGWVQKDLSMDANAWTRLDPTFASNSDDEGILDYIGDGDNYSLQYSR